MFSPFGFYGDLVLMGIGAASGLFLFAMGITEIALGASDDSEGALAFFGLVLCIGLCVWMASLI